MIEIGDVVDNKYLVTGVCSDSGGMGLLLYIEPIQEEFEHQIVLKYCRDTSEEQLKRFRREVRLLSSFEGNSRVAQLEDFNVDIDPPYYVMRFYEDGDLISLIDDLKQQLDRLEEYLIQTIECIQELHSRDEYHRDIKPQNFLVDGPNIVVSDFGLSKEIGSETEFTKSSMLWGTRGYIPPEFYNKGGFKNADAQSDIFMLGKTFYVLSSNRDPTYLVADDIAPPLFHVIERCCSIEKTGRYADLADLRQALTSAFDVILGRGGTLGKAKQQLDQIEDSLEDQKYSSSVILEFIENLALLDSADQRRLCIEIPQGFYGVMRQTPVQGALPTFLDIIDNLVESKDYSWGYAETIATRMKRLFSSDEVSNESKAKALDLAIRAAVYMNRFAAMDTCTGMITSIIDEDLGLQVASIIIKHKGTFIDDIERSECKSEVIRNALPKSDA